MADQKLSELTALTNANLATDDLILVTDTSATESKSVTIEEADKRWGHPVDEYSSAQTLTAGNKIVIGDTSSAGFTVTLPAASTSTDYLYRIQKKSGSTDFNKLTISDGGSFSAFLYGAGETITVVSDGTAWTIVDSGMSEVMDWTITTNASNTEALGKVRFCREFLYIESAHILVDATGAATAMTVTLPGSITFNTSNLSNGTDVSNAGATNLGGQNTWFDSGAGWRFVQAKYLTSTTFGFWMNTQALNLDLLANGDSIQFPGLRIPVS